MKLRIKTVIYFLFAMLTHRLTKRYVVLLEVVTFIPKTLLQAEAAVLRGLGFDELAQDADDVRASIEATTDAVSEFSRDLREQLSTNMVGAVEGIRNFGENSDATTRSIADTGRALRSASGDVREFASEVGSAASDVKLQKALRKTSDALGDTATNASNARKALDELGEAGEGAAPGLNAAGTAAKGLNTTLESIAKGSAEVARGLADIGPAAERIAKSISQITLAQTDEQETKRRQEALVASFVAADKALSDAVQEAFKRRQAAIAPAQAQAVGAKAELGRAREEGSGADIERAIGLAADAQAALEIATRRADDAFRAQRETIQEAHRIAQDEIAKTTGAVEALRLHQIESAKAVGAAEIKRLEDQADAETDVIARQLAQGDISRLLAETHGCGHPNRHRNADRPPVGHPQVAAGLRGCEARSHARAFPAGERAGKGRRLRCTRLD